MMTRRHALQNLLIWAAGSPLLRAQQPPAAPPAPERMPPLDELVNVFEFEPVARMRIPRSAYDYVVGGSDGEWTLQRNRDAFGHITLRPRFLVDVSKLDMSLDLFGHKIEMPILLSPTGALGLLHADGELATAKAAGAVKTIMAVSSNSSFPIDKIGAAATGTLWFQLYTAADLDGTRERVERALAAGCKAICFTVDSAYSPYRERMLRNRVAGSVPQQGPAAPSRVERPGGRRVAQPPPEQYRLRPSLLASLTWSFLDQLNGWAKAPVLVKGILTPEDAVLCVKHGAAGVIVSNHGARYLDHVPSTIEVLPEIVDAVGGKIPVLIDGGFRRGTDILKALAIGAKAVMVGRPHVWGLGAFGQPGVQRALELLQTELARAMGLAGRPTLASIDRTAIRIER